MRGGPTCPPSGVVMKAILSARILTAILAGCWLPAAAMGQITFVKAPEGTVPPVNRQAQQGGLSPEKKKSLSRYGPEDAFPGANEQENRQRQTNRPAQRRSGATASPTITPTPAPPTTPIQSPIAAPSPTISSTPATTAKLNDAASTSTTPPANQSSDSGLMVSLSLATAALLVFGALVYVVGTLRKKIKGTR